MSSVATPVVAHARPTAAELRRQLEQSLADRIPAAFTVHDRSLPDLASSGIAALDTLTGGLPRGALTEIFGPPSSGRSSVLIAALAAATARGEACALIDTTDSFDPESAAAAGVDLARLLWIRCTDTPPRRHTGRERLPNCRTAELPNVKSADRNSPPATPLQDCHSEARSATPLQNCHSEARRATPLQNCHSEPRRTTLLQDCHSEARSAEESAFRFGHSAVRQFGNAFPSPPVRDIGIWGYGDMAEMQRIRGQQAAPRRSPAPTEKLPIGDHEVSRAAGATRRSPDPPILRSSDSQFRTSAVRQSGNCYARLDQALKAADLLLSGGGFGLVALDLADVPAEAARRVPLTSWFRFRRAVENTPAVLLVVTPQAVTQSCASLVLDLRQSAVGTQQSAGNSQLSAEEMPGRMRMQETRSNPQSAIRNLQLPAHARLLSGFAISAHVVRAPTAQRKSARSAHAEFDTRALWAG